MLKTHKMMNNLLEEFKNIYERGASTEIEEIKRWMNIYDKLFEELIIEDVIIRTEKNTDGLIYKIKEEVYKLKEKALKEGIEDWPKGQCKYISFNLADTFEDIWAVTTEYVGPGDRCFKTDHHMINFHKKSNRLIDATMQQYNRNFPEIAVLKNDDPIKAFLYNWIRSWESSAYYDPEQEAALMFGY